MQILVLEDPARPNPTLKALDFGFDILFAVEMLLRIGAHGSRRYWQRKWTRFDGIIVLVVSTIFASTLAMLRRLKPYLAAANRPGRSTWWNGSSKVLSPRRWEWI